MKRFDPSLQRIQRTEAELRPWATGHSVGYPNMRGATTLTGSGIPSSVFVVARLNQGRTEPIQQVPIPIFLAPSINESAATQQSSSACFPDDLVATRMSAGAWYSSERGVASSLGSFPNSRHLHVIPVTDNHELNFVLYSWFCPLRRE